MTFDAAAITRALTPPAIKVERTEWWARALRGILGARTPSWLVDRTYTGRILSHAEFEPFRARWMAAWSGKVDDTEAKILVREYVEAIGIPYRVIERLPWDVAVEALRDFLSRQALALTRGQTPARVDATSGTR